MREMISMIVVLTVLTAVSGGLLAAVQSGTEVRIENQVLKFQKAPAIKDIFPEATNDPLAERFTIKTEDIELQIFPTKLADGSNAIAFETKGSAFGGPIGLMVGINLSTDEIVDVRVTTHAETPGIGSRAKEDLSFVSQFSGLKMDTNFALKGGGGVIDAMSGATVTSKGVSVAAIQAKEIYQKLKPEIVKQMK
ncbi:MAG: RnfABCDGE type electron transport complex subunit G [Proteobacteria bacterium]|nr:RnfABCDGE type electron transport complex subunit G [Pseudomonadota bacterium]MBU1585860.1 RnfABCDGE type electron transport complex subunit G [Pseudomonadota bacterium]MBU2455130.1 RnfABCDGE type electron transport complex subunit G [Pseudomonadota bacterium]MBU2629978.1 RnfABCDGE type electron transport complex subunit G [Pseudomonadota bacterium]